MYTFSRLSLTLHIVSRRACLASPSLCPAAAAALQARAVNPTLNPIFRSSEPMHFENVSLRSQIQVQLYDTKNLSKSLLGKAALPAAAIPGSDPVYLWLPLSPPEDSRRLSLVRLLSWPL
jgi:hypothetical protein